MTAALTDTMPFANITSAFKSAADIAASQVGDVSQPTEVNQLQGISARRRSSSSEADSTLQQYADGASVSFAGRNLSESLEKALPATMDRRWHVHTGRLLEEQTSFMSHVETELRRLGDDQRELRQVLMDRLETSTRVWKLESTSLAESLAQLRSEVAQTMEAALWSGKELGAVRQELVSTCFWKHPQPKLHLQHHNASTGIAVTSRKKFELPPTHLSTQPDQFELNVSSLEDRLVMTEDLVHDCWKRVAENKEFVAQALSQMSNDVVQLVHSVGKFEERMLTMEARNGVGTSNQPQLLNHFPQVQFQHPRQLQLPPAPDKPLEAPAALANSKPISTTLTLPPAPTSPVASARRPSLTRVPGSLRRSSSGVRRTSTESTIVK